MLSRSKALKLASHASWKLFRLTGVTPLNCVMSRCALTLGKQRDRSAALIGLGQTRRCDVTTLVEVHGCLVARNSVETPVCGQ